VLATHASVQAVIKRRRVLTESGGIGRTEQFMAVRLAGPAAAGAIIDLTITGHDGCRLLAA